jgi:hypothetical protein
MIYYPVELAGMATWARRPLVYGEASSVELLSIWFLSKTTYEACATCLINRFGVAYR